ncbi:MAG: YkgJ family cysteine cluster protein [Anaerolineae bacterium]
MLRTLQLEWFTLLEKLLQRRQTLPPTGLKCLTRCESLCCPRIQMRRMNPERIASPVVVLLPFEMEFLTKQICISNGAFRRRPIRLVPDVTVEIGMMDLGKPCPFLQPDFHCAIYNRKPIDCQTFPMLPHISASGQLAWDVDKSCPSVETLNPVFVKQIQEIWTELHAHLPAAWWALYDWADDWTGWPPPQEDPHAA